MALVPYADLINHSPYASSYFLTNQLPFSDEKEVTLYADRGYAKNAQEKWRDGAGGRGGAWWRLAAAVAHRCAACTSQSAHAACRM